MKVKILLVCQMKSYSATKNNRSIKVSIIYLIINTRYSITKNNKV